MELPTVSDERTRLSNPSAEGFRRLVASPPAPIATGWSDPCREGLAPSQELCLSTAHDFITTIAGLTFRYTQARWRACHDRAATKLPRAAASSGMSVAQFIEALFG